MITAATLVSLPLLGRVGRARIAACFLGLFFSVSLVAAAAGDAPAPAPAETKPPPQRSLDQLLLEGLDNPLLEGLSPQPPATEQLPAKPRAADGEATELDRMLRKQLGQGEDLGREAADPFLAIGQRMRAAEALIGRRDTSGSERVQREIIDDLDRLIEQMKKQCASGQCNSDSSQSAAPSAASAKPGSKAASGENRGSKQPAKESVEQVGRSDGQEAYLARMRELHKQVWGHLPARLREPMQSGMAEEFLPQYERLIEQYYQRLAEEPGAR